MKDRYGILRKLGFGPAPAQKQSMAGPMIALHGQGAPVWTPRQYGDLAQE